MLDGVLSKLSSIIQLRILLMKEKNRVKKAEGHPRYMTTISSTKNRRQNGNENEIKGMYEYMSRKVKSKCEEAPWHLSQML